MGEVLIIYLKGKKEINMFLKAGYIAGLILSKLLSSSVPGITPQQLDEMAKNECKKHNVKPAFLGYNGFPAALCVSVNETIVHGIPSNKPLKIGDVVSLDMGTDLDGYIGDTAETITIGAENKPVVIRCQEALKRGIEAAQPGNRLEDIGYAISKEKDFKIITDYGGHGVDRNILHSDPFVNNFGEKGKGLELRPGMVFAIEPMLVTGDDNKGYISKDGWSIKLKNGIAAHSEHTIAITENGPIILTERKC